MKDSDNAADIEAAFIDAIRSAGLTPPSKIVADGTLHRFASNGKSRDDAGWYILHSGEPAVGMYGCWRTGIRQTWCSRERRTLSAEERRAFAKRVREARNKAQRELEARQAKARTKANAEWAKAKPADATHPYLAHKAVRAHGIRQLDGELLIPLRNGEGTLHGLQRINATGDKSFPYGTAKRGNYHMMGECNGRLIIAEGFATGASIHEATDTAVVVAFDAGNLRPVALALRQKYPHAEIVLAGDNDASGVGQDRAREAAAAAGGKVVICPDVKDFNDLAKARGLDAVRAALAVAAKPEPEAEAIEDAIKRLAQLHPIEFDRVAEQEAKKLKCNVGTLRSQVGKARGGKGDGNAAGGTEVVFPEIESWPAEVDGKSLLDEISDAMARHVMLPARGADAIALWILFAHTHDSAAISPLLALTSPSPECGKSTALVFIGALVPKPLPSSNITAAALFRAVEKWCPSLLIDEGDTFLRDSDELRGIVNSGHNRGSAYVIRTVGEDHEPRRFRTWAPKAIALIGKLPATLESRAIHIELRRLSPGESVIELRADRCQHLEPLARKAARWTADNMDTLRRANPCMPSGLKGRSADNWRQLFAVADVVGGAWPERARTAARALTKSDAGHTVGIELLADTKMIFGARGVERIRSADLAAALADMEGRPWPEWRHGKPITQNQIARLLAYFKIKSEDYKFDGKTAKGYEASAFADAWQRYLSPDTASQSATPQPSKETAAFRGFQSATSEPPVADQKGQKPAENNESCGVADQKPLHWQRVRL